MRILLAKNIDISEGLKALAPCGVGAFLDSKGYVVFRDLVRQKIIGINKVGVFPYPLWYETVKETSTGRLILVDIPSLLDSGNLPLPQIIERIVYILQRNYFVGYVYIVGGYVRDWLIGKTTYDLDLSVYGDFQKFTDIMRVNFSVRSFPLGIKIISNNIKLDITYSRYDFYPRLGKMPVVVPASLSADLERRDFTMGALAYMVYPYRGILDPFDGLRDVKRGLIRYIRLYSPYEDPSRILRGIRYSKKLGFTWDSKSHYHSKIALQKHTNFIVSRRYFKELENLVLSVGMSHFLDIEKEWNILENLTFPYHDIILRHINSVDSFNELKFLIMKAYKVVGRIGGYSVLGMNKKEVQLFKRCYNVSDFLECIKEGIRDDSKH